MCWTSKHSQNNKVAVAEPLDDGYSEQSIYRTVRCGDAGSEDGYAHVPTRDVFGGTRKGYG